MPFTGQKSSQAQDQGLRFWQTKSHAIIVTRSFACDESPSSISERSIPFSHEDSSVGDHQRDGAEQQRCLGEISAARRALEASPGTEATYRALTDVRRRPPPEPRDAIPDMMSEPLHPFQMEKEMFLQNLKTARKGAAGGPSSMRNEHLHPLWTMMLTVPDSSRFSQAFAQALIPDEIESALRVGQLTALEKPNGGETVVGDVTRRLVAKTMS